MTFFIVAKGL
jgi:hypothetical protein